MQPNVTVECHTELNNCLPVATITSLPNPVFIFGDLNMGHFVPNQQKKIPTLLDFWHGLYKETFSHQNLADFIDLPLRYDHLNFILKYHFSLHMLNKMAITLSVIVIELFCLHFWNAH